MKKPGSIKQWAEGVRAGLERVRSARALTPAPPIRPDPKLEPLEPRILLSADVGLVPDEGLALVALTSELIAPQVEIHDEVLVRESSDPDPQADERDLATEHAAADLSESERVTGAAAEDGAATGDASTDSSTHSSTHSPTESEANEQGDPGRADRALSSLVWSEAGSPDGLAVREIEDVAQLVVIDGRVPEVESLLASLLESTADLEPFADGATGDAAAAAPDAVATAAGTDSSTPFDSSAEATADALESRGIRVIVLDDSRDGLDQVGEILEAFQGVTALHLVSHGSAGSLQLGKGKVNAETLQQRMRDLRQWGRSLSADADILLYGCHVAEGEVGIEFVSQLAGATGADVAASTDATGGAGFGDWDLELATGAIEAQTLEASAFAAALDTATVMGTSGNETITIAHDGTNWTSQIGAGAIQDLTFASDPNTDPDDLIEIDAAGGVDRIVIASAAPAFNGTIRINGTSGVDDITVVVEATTFNGDLEVVAGTESDAVTLENVVASFAGTITVEAGRGLDTITVEGAETGFAGTLDLQGGLGGDIYAIQSAEFGAVAISDSGGSDTLTFADASGSARSTDFVASNSVTYAAAEVERVEGLTLNAGAIDGGLAALVTWAEALASTGELGQQIAGLSGTADIGIATAMDLADVFEQLRVHVLAAAGTNGEMSAEELQQALASFGTASGEELGYVGSALFGSVLNPNFSQITEDVVFEIELDQILETISVVRADFTDLTTLVRKLNEAIGDTGLSGQLRAVEAVGVAGDASRRLAFEVLDSTSRDLRVTGKTVETVGAVIGAGAGRLGFTEGSDRTLEELDTELKGLGKLNLGPAGFVDPGSLIDVLASIDVTNGEPTLEFGFHLEAARNSEFRIDLGEEADELGLEFAGAKLTLGSRFEADLVLRLMGDAAAGSVASQQFEIDISNPILSAEVLDGSGTGGGNLFNDPASPVDMNIGFLGARIGPETIPAPSGTRGEIELHLAYDGTGVEWTSLNAGGLATETASEALLGDRAQSITTPNVTTDETDVFRVDLPVEITGMFLDGIAKSLLSIDNLEVDSTLLTGPVSVLDGRDALGTDAFSEFDEIANFAKFDPTSYISLLGQIRSGLDAIRQSELFQSLDLPFVEGSVGKVFDLADAFGDAILFDDGDDGIDSRDRNVLVTRLNESLAAEKLDRLVQFRVTDVGENTTKLELVAVSPNVTMVTITGANELGFGDDQTDSKEHAEKITADRVVTLDALKTSGWTFDIKVQQRGELPADARTETFSADGGIASDADGYADSASSLTKFGNDVAKLLDESNTATFDTVQELASKLIDIAFDGIISDDGDDSDLPVKWNSVDRLLTFELSFDADLIDLELPLDFDLDLGPIGSIGVEEGAQLTVGGEVDFSLTLGLNLGPLSGRAISEAADSTGTKIDDLAGVDERTDIVKLTPSITAERPSGETVNEDEEDAVALELGRVEMVIDDSNGPEKVRFGTSQNFDVVAESLINSVMSLTSPANTTIEVRGPEGVLQTSNGRTVPMGDVPMPVWDTVDEVWKVAGFTFDVTIDDETTHTVEGETFSVTIADRIYEVKTSSAAKTLLLRDVEKAISDAQSAKFDSTIVRSVSPGVLGGSWIDDGFGAGDFIRLKNAGNNDGLYEIDEVTADTITLKGDLVEKIEVDATAAGLEIVGPGTIAFNDAKDGGWSFALGERIVLAGTEVNDGSYLITRVLDGPVDQSGGEDVTNDVLVVNSFFDLFDESGQALESASTGIQVTSTGAPVRVDLETTAEDATFDLKLEIDGAVRTVNVVVSRDGEMLNDDNVREEGAASDLSNNRNLSDLSADVQNAIDDAIDRFIDDHVDGMTDEQAQAIRDDAPKVKVGLNGTRLVVTLDDAKQVADAASLSFVVSGSSVTVVRPDSTSFATGGDEFRTGQRVLVAGTDGFDGEYVISGVGDDQLILDPTGTLPSGPTENNVQGAVVTETFSIENTNTVAHSVLGLGSAATPDLAATLDDLVIVAADGTTVRVTLDGAKQVADVMKRINDALDDAVAGDDKLGEIVLNDEKTGFNVVQDASLADVFTEKFRVESVNGSGAAVRLGIIGPDARGDENLDGEIDQHDGDGVIEGAPVGGATLFDRFYLEDVTLELALDVDLDLTPENDGDPGPIYGDFGFFDVRASASGDVTAVASFTIQDPVEDTGGIRGITLSDLYDAIRDFDLLVDMFNPKEAFDFGGAQVDKDAGLITFGDDGEQGTITRTDGDWEDDRFEAHQRITINDAAGLEHVLDIVKVDGKILTVDGKADALADGVAGKLSGDGQGVVSVESALATLRLGGLELPGGLSSFTGLDDAEVVFSLLDIGNPFFSEELPSDDSNIDATFTAKNVLLLGAGIDIPGSIRIGDTVEIEYKDANGALVVASAVIKTLGKDDGKDEITLKTEAIEGDVDLGELDVTKLTFERPIRYEIETPDFGDLLDISDIGFEQILDGLIALADFLDDFESFAFLDSDIPVIGVSVNDLLGYADQFRDMVNEIKSDPAGSFQTLELKLEELLGIGEDSPFDIGIEFVTEDRGEAGEADDHKIAKLTFDVGAEFRKALGVEFSVGDIGKGENSILAGAADLEAYGGIGLNLALGIDLTKTRVHGIDDLTLKLLHTDAPGGDTIRREDTGSFLTDGFMVGQDVEIDGLKGSYEIESILEDGKLITLKQNLQITETDEQTIEASKLEGDRSVSLYGSTGITGRLTGEADDVSFRAAIGPLGVFIEEDRPDVTAVTLGGLLERDTNGDGEIDLDDDKLIFDAGLTAADDERVLIGQLGFDDFNIEVKAGIDAHLPVAFPTASLDRGWIEFNASVDVDLQSDDKIQFTTDLRALDVDRQTELDSLADLFSLEGLGELSIFDNILLAVDGIDFFLAGLQDILDGEVFGFELPLIGDGLSGGADFIADLRDGFLADFREGVEDAEDFVADLSDPNKNFISELLFDVLSGTGLLLVEVDGELVKATQAGLEAGQFELSDAISLLGGDNGLPDLTASINDLTAWIKDPESEIKWNMTLGQNLLDVDTDLDIDLGIPGLGFEAEGPLGLKLGWNLDFGFGMNFTDGVFLDIVSDDGTDLEVNVGVTLPDRLAGQLAFLQLDAINDGSFLGATFVVDVYNSAEAGDENLSFTELSKLRLRAEVEAQALASFDMVLALNSDLIPNASSVFPTIGAGFELDWSIGGHLGKDYGDVTISGNQLTRTVGSWAEEGFRVEEKEEHRQRMIVGGFEDSAFDGEYMIVDIIDDGRTIVFDDENAVTGSKTISSGLEAQSFQNILAIDGELIKTGLNLVEFQSITLDLGSFISDLIAPILSEIQEVTRPLQPIVDLITSPLPVVSEFAGDTTLLDLAGVFGTVRPEFLKAIADVITLANAIPAEKGEVKIDFGDFTIFSRRDGDADQIDLTDPNFDKSKIDKPADLDKDTFDNALDDKSGSSADKKNKSFANKLKNLEGFSFPFLSNPTELFGLFTGDPVTLIGYDMPALDFDFSYTQKIPIYGPLMLGIGGQFGAHIDFAFGFDTEGISQFADSGFRNPLLIFNGLFVSDNPEDPTGKGPDLPELTFTGGFTITAELNLLIARAGAGGGLFAEIFFDLFDPDHDGRVRILEIAENFVTEFEFGSPLLAPLAIFDISGNVTARLFAFLEIDLLFFSLYKEWDLVPPITLIDFDLEFQRKPKLASELGDGVLQLNMGDFAGQRLNGDLSDGNEHFEVRTTSSGEVEVRALGLGTVATKWQNYGRATTILALGGSGNDVIDLSRVAAGGIRFDIEGGDGNDTLIGGTSTAGGTFKGGLGDDVIVGSDGDDVIYGEAGSDVIDGGAGNDIIFADGGRLVEGESRVTRVDLEFVPEQGVISRANDALWKADGFEAGQTVEISGSTLAVENGSDGNNGFYKVHESWTGGPLMLQSFEGGDVTLQFERTDEIKIEIVGTNYLRSIQAQAGANDGDDVVLGGAGGDAIFGAGGADLILGAGAFVTAETETTAGLRSRASLLANPNYPAAGPAGSSAANGTLTAQLRELVKGDPDRDIVGAIVEDDDGGATDTDILIGDAGEIRYRLGTDDPTFRDVIETNRGIFFGADDIRGHGGEDLIYGGQGDDVVRGGAGNDLIYGESGLDRLYGDAGNDEIHGGRDADIILGGENDDDLYGNEAGDVILGEGGDDEIYGQAGSDWLWGGTDDDTIDGGGERDTIYGGAGRDVLDGGAGDDVVYGEVGVENSDVEPADGILDAGIIPADLPEFAAPYVSGSELPPIGEGYSDILFVGGGNDRLDGEWGADEYIVNMRGAANDAIVPIRDTGTAGVDRLTVNGTDFDDLFLLRKTQYLENSPTPVAEQFDGFVTSINRDGALERVDYDGIDRIVVNGQQGNDEFAVDDVGGSTELNGGGGRDLFKVGQIYKTPRINTGGEDSTIVIGDYFDTIETTRGWLSNGIDQPMTINAGADNDEIIVLRNLDVLQVNGEEGDDQITVRAFALTQAEIERQKDLTAEEAEKLERDETKVVGGAGADLIQYAVNAPVNIDGGDGLDTVSVIGTEFDDDFVITDTGVYGAGLNVNLVNVELLNVDGAEGDDAFFVQSTQDGLITQIFGGLGSDTFDVAGDAPPVVSNDLLGHSGLITHGIESNDLGYLGAEGDGIAVHGISANVADDDEPFARITLTDGETRIGEGAFDDLYYIALTRQPDEDEVVRIDVLAPSLTPEEAARGANKFWIRSDNPDEAVDAPDGSSISLFFTHDDWADAQAVYVSATGTLHDIAGNDIHFDDDALEGERFGVINHQVQSLKLDRTTPHGSKYDSMALPSVSVQIEDNDEADVLIFETDGETRVGEDTLGVVDEYAVQLDRAPADGTVEVHITITPPEGIDPQVSVSSTHDDSRVEGATLILVFDAENYADKQTVTVTAVTDDVREGFHRDFIQHMVVAADDESFLDETTDAFTPASKTPTGQSIWPSTSVLLTQQPTQEVGVVGEVAGTTFFLDVGQPEANTLRDHIVRLSSGPSDGQVRRIVANGTDTDGRHWIEIDRAWDVEDDDEAALFGSDFRTYDVSVTIDPAEMTGAPEITIDEVAGTIVRSAGDWGAAGDGFLPGHEIIVQDDQGTIRRYVIDTVSRAGLQVERVVGDGEGPAPTDPIVGARVFVAPLEMDRFFVNSSTLVFLDEDGRPETRLASHVDATYDYLVEGFDESRQERIVVEVIDDDTAGVVVTETGVSTDVTEGGWFDDGVTPPAWHDYTVDSYEVMLTKAPVFTGTEQAYVEVIVTPEITRTTAGSSAFEQKQVRVAAGDSSMAPNESAFEDQIVLRFTADDWNVAQTVWVAAIDDNAVDGNDTQVFPEIPHTVANIQGPLLIDGMGGQGSLVGLLRPVMLDGETSQRPEDGSVQAISANGLVVERSALEGELADLVGRTVELIDIGGIGRGPGDGDFTLITGATDLEGDLVRLELDPGWNLEDADFDEIGDGVATSRYGFTITDESSNFFEDETEQVDLLRVNDEDNPADYEAGHPNGGGALTSFEPGDYPETRGLLVGEDDDDGFTQGQWGRIIGLGMSPDSFIGRAIRPGGITFGRVDGLEINLGLGDNRFVIDALHQRNDGVNVYTVVNGGAGDDEILVSVQAPADPASGIPFLRIDAGDGDDIVNGSPEGMAASTLPMQIQGGLGGDTLTGGEADDLIFGDFGDSGVTHLVDFDAELILRLAARRAPTTDAAVAPGTTPSALDPLAVPARLAAQIVPSVGTTRVGEGGRDQLYGMGGDDRMFGGAGSDDLFGDRGDDILIGDYGRVNDLTSTRRMIETSEFFEGAADGLVAGEGNDVLLGGFGGDSLVGELGRDLLIGDHLRTILESGRVISANRLVAGGQDLAATSVFGLYSTHTAPGGSSGAVADVPRTIEPGVAQRTGADAGSSTTRDTSGGGDAMKGRHEVESGDNLWAISGRELGDPFRWPEVAEANKHLIGDPNVIEPSWVLRIPSTVTEQDATLKDADAARSNLAEIDERTEAQQRGWGFSTAGEDAQLPAVGEGPVERDAAPLPEQDDLEPAGELPDQGLNDADTADEPAELLSAVWAGLTGWQTRVARRRQVERRWLAFDAQSGRFSHAQIDTERVAGDTHTSRW